MNKFMQVAIQQAFQGLQKTSGGPFGAVIVKDGEIIATGYNKVIETNDPTAHAEVNAIREASKKLGRFDLSDCEIYSTCEPCPMCFAAIHWAKIPRLYYGCTRDDAARAGFDDKLIYEAIRGTAKEQHLELIQIDRENCMKPMKEWESKKDKVTY